jgi:hypothetical protein
MAFREKVLRQLRAVFRLRGYRGAGSVSVSMGKNRFWLTHRYARSDGGAIPMSLEDLEAVCLHLQVPVDLVVGDLSAEGLRAAGVISGPQVGILSDYEAARASGEELTGPDLAPRWHGQVSEIRRLVAAGLIPAGTWGPEAEAEEES